MNGQLKMLFDRSEWDRELRILICVEAEGIITHVAKPVEIELVPREIGKPLGETFVVSHHIEAEGFLQSIHKSLKYIGSRAEPDSKLAGELEGIKKHLEDLRNILGLDDPKCEKRLTINRSL
jgi:hypothetical protein